MWAFPAKEISMDQRDWQLLDKQLRVPNLPRRNDTLTALTVVAVFLAGIAFGSLAFTHRSTPIRTALNQTAAMTCDYKGACRVRSHSPAAGTLSAL
jgi:hypothetical protein